MRYFRRSYLNVPAKAPQPWWQHRLLWIIVAAIFVVWAIMTQPGDTTEVDAQNITYSNFLQYVADDAVASVTISGASISGTMKFPIPTDNAGQTTMFVTYAPTQVTEGLVKTLLEHHVAVEFLPQTDTNPFWSFVVFLVLPVLILFLLFRRMTRRSPASNGLGDFSRSHPRLHVNEKTDIAFADVAGVDEAKAELVEVVDFLKSPSRYMRLGAMLPRGILLTGPPGTGKTLLARAVAGEANVPFFSLSGSEFVELYVGVGASRVRDLFDQAKKSSPCIVFIDELDAVGHTRAADLAGGNSEHEQTIDQVLAEMDGFDRSQAVIVLAATNRPDVLDPALLRPGRFDRQIVVDRPDVVGREAILRVHARSVPLAPDVDLDKVSRSTSGMAGADLANLINEAALAAARHGLDTVSHLCFEEALDRIVLGARRPMLLSTEMRQVIAYHEAGHAVVALLTPGADPVRKVSIIPRGQALGMTLITPADDLPSQSRPRLLAHIAVALGGRVAEELVVGEITTGAENDLQQATRLAHEMVTRWGMSDKIGAVFLAEEQGLFAGGLKGSGVRQGYSEQMAILIDEEVRRIIRQCYDAVRQLLQQNRTILEQVAHALLSEEVVGEQQLHEIVRTVREPSNGESADCPAGHTPEGAPDRLPL